MYLKKKNTYNFNLFKLKNSDLNLIFFTKNHLEEGKIRCYQKLKWNAYRPDICGNKCNILFLSKLVFPVVLMQWKRITVQISVK